MHFWRLQFVLCRAIWCSVMETQTQTDTHAPACTLLPRNPDTLPCFHAPPLPTTRGAKNRWQRDRKGWKKERNRRKGWGRESQLLSQSSSKMRGGRAWEKEIQCSKKKKNVKTRKKERHYALPLGCQAEHSPVGCLPNAPSQLGNLSRTDIQYPTHMNQQHNGPKLSYSMTTYKGKENTDYNYY